MAHRDLVFSRWTHNYTMVDTYYNMDGSEWWISNSWEVIDMSDRDIVLVAYNQDTFRHNDRNSWIRVIDSS